MTNTSISIKSFLITTKNIIQELKNLLDGEIAHKNN